MPFDIAAPVLKPKSVQKKTAKVMPASDTEEIKNITNSDKNARLLRILNDMSTMRAHAAILHIPLYTNDTFG